MKEFSSDPTPPQFGVEQFPSEPNQDFSSLEAIGEIVDKYPEFNETSEGPCISVERQTDDGKFSAYVREDFFVTRFTDPEGSESGHRYCRGPDGNMHRFPFDMDEFSRRVPSIGAAPVSLIREMLREKSVEEVQVGKLQLEMGEDHLVGKPELEYVMGNIKESEPATYPLSAIFSAAILRLRSPIKPTEEESKQAAKKFEKQLDAYLQRNGQGDDKVMRTQVPSEDGSQLVIQAGRSINEDVPLATFRFSGDAGFITGQAPAETETIKGARLEIAYVVNNEGKFIVGMEGEFADENGAVVARIPKSYSLADEGEVRTVRNFLRRPLMVKSESPTPDTDKAEE